MLGVQQQLSVSGVSSARSDIGEDESLDRSNTYMTCLWSANQLGVAYFDQTTGRVSL